MGRWDTMSATLTPIGTECCVGYRGMMAHTAPLTVVNAEVDCLGILGGLQRRKAAPLPTAAMCLNRIYATTLGRSHSLVAAIFGSFVSTPLVGLRREIRAKRPAGAR